MNLYLSSSCCTLLDVNKDKFHKALHEPSNQDVLTQFAQERSQRALLVSRVDQRGGAEDEERKGENTGTGSPTKHMEGEQIEEGRDKGEMGETELL